MRTKSTLAPSRVDIGLMGLLDTAKMKEKRLALEFSQDQAASAAGLPGGKGRWADIESGRRANVTLDTLERIAAALKCEPAELLAKAKGKK